MSITCASHLSICRRVTTFYLVFLKNSFPIKLISFISVASVIVKVRLISKIVVYEDQVFCMFISIHYLFDKVNLGLFIKKNTKNQTIKFYFLLFFIVSLDQNFTKLGHKKMVTQQNVQIDFDYYLFKAFCITLHGVFISYLKSLQ